MYALMMLSAIDGRYARTAKELAPYMSEFALIRERLNMQVTYLQALRGEPEIPELRGLTAEELNLLNTIVDTFGVEDAQVVKDIETKGYPGIVEKKTNHDVVAVILWLRHRLKDTSMADLAAWAHFGNTSED